MPELDAYDKKTLERIMRKVQVDPESGCWLWQGYRRDKGHGQVGYRGALRSPYRVVYELTVGPIPAGLHLDHFACDNPPCCNPQHVRPVTPRENSLRGTGIAAVNAAKTHCKRGHEYTPDNTQIDKLNRRHCRECWRIENRARKNRHKGGVR